MDSARSVFRVVSIVLMCAVCTIVACSINVNVPSTSQGASGGTGGGAMAASSSGGGMTNAGGMGGAGMGGGGESGGASNGGGGSGGGGMPLVCKSDHRGRPWTLHTNAEMYHWAPAARISVSGVNFFELTIGDVTGDGRADIVGAEWDTTWIFPQDENGALLSPISVPHGFGNPGGVALLQATPDSLLDFVVPTSTGIELFPSLGTNMFGPPSFIEASVDAPLVVADINRDGIDDVIALWSQGLIVTSGTGTGTLENAHLHPNSFGKVGYPLAMGDATGDKIPDIVTVAPDSLNVARLRIIAHDGMQDLTTSGWTTVDIPGGTIWGMDVGDVNGDGWLDAVVQQEDGSYDHRGRLLLGTASGFGPAIEIASAKYGGTVKVDDANADGRDDVVLLHEGGFETSLVLATATGMGSPMTYGKPTAASLLSPLAVGDIDCDGCPDVIGADVGGLIIYRGLDCGP